LQWRDASCKYRPYKTLYNRFVRWGRDIYQDFQAFAQKHRHRKCLIIVATHLKAHSTAASLLKKGLLAVPLEEPKAG